MELVARDRELADVVDRVTGGRRLVSVVGPGGIGKTALARAAVDRLTPRYPMGGHVVELSRIDRPDAVAGAMAGQLGFASFEVLLASPIDLPVLLFVDNCEHVADAAADAVAALLEACDAVTVVATSRSPLAVPGESIVALGPIAVPAPGAVDTEVGAVRLFLERALDAGVVVGDDDLELVGELCRRLDGVPLAIELAAARLRVLTLSDIVERLGAGIDVLRRARHRGASRHRSLSDTIAWSVRLLDADDRAAFARLGVCAGRFTAELAGAVIGGGTAADRRTTDTDPVPVVERLVEASLLVVERATTATRYRMLEPIRAVALDDLAGRAEVVVARERLAHHVHGWTEAMLDVIAVRWDADLLPTLIDRFDLIDAALRHSLDHDRDPRRALVLYGALWGMVHQARVDEVLALGALVIGRWPDPSAPHGADAAATYAMGKLLCGDTEEAQVIARAALPHAGAAPFAPATLRRVLGLAARFQGDHEAAAALLAEAASAAAERGIVTMDLECRVYRAQDLAALGAHAEAAAVVRAAAQEARRRNSIINVVWARTVEASIPFVVERGPQSASAGAGTDEQRRAAALAADTLRTSEAIAYPFGIICNLQTLATWHLRAGDLAAAVESAERLLDAVARSGSGDFRRCLDLTAAVLAAAGHPDARHLAATARQLPDTNPMVLAPLESAVGPTAGSLVGGVHGLSRGPGDGMVLDRPTATRLARRALAEVRSAEAVRPPLTAAEVPPVRTSHAPKGHGPARQAEPSPRPPTAHDLAQHASEPRSTRPGDPLDEAVFARAGGVWQVAYGGVTAFVRPSKGMDDLAVLLREPGREVHCLELAGAAVEQADTGEVIDAAARRRYEARVRELQADIEEADSYNDRGRADKARAELDALVDHLAAALGLSGRTRRQGGTAERARSAVTHRLRAAVRQIDQAHPLLGRHLHASLRTGLYCSYRPETPLRWRT